MEHITEYENVHENRKYKDTLFRIVFQDKRDLLDLYNAVNGTSHENPDDLEINTLENVLYMSYKNDLSFLIGCTLNLYEHQSTGNENMPLRGLLYFAKLLDKYVTENGIDLYQKRIQKIPAPQYVIFYNGTAAEPDERTLRLSDAFLQKGGCLECEAKLLNINYGHNRDLMEKCKRLEEYALFIKRVRIHIDSGKYSRKEAILRAVEECISENILRDILIKNKSEVVGMVLTTFNQELYEKNLKADAYEEGVTAGKIDGYHDGYTAGSREQILRLISLKLSKGKSPEEIADALEEDVAAIRTLIEEIKRQE